MRKEETCPYCGEEFLNLQAHLRYCKEKQKHDDLIVPPKKEDHQTPNQTPIDPTLTEEWRQEKAGQPKGERQFHNIQELLENLPRWKPEKTLIERIKNIGKKQKQKTIVFLNEGEEPTCVKLDWDEEKNAITIPGMGYYRMPAHSTQGNIVFFHKKHMLPLLDCPRVAEEYDTPTDQALAIHNAALIEGRLQSFDELIRQIQKWQTIVTIALIAVIVAAIMVMYTAHSFDQAIHTINTVPEVVSVK